MKFKMFANFICAECDTTMANRHRKTCKCINPLCKNCGKEYEIPEINLKPVKE